MEKLKEFDQRYMALVLEINKHIAGYIDAYIGPLDLKDEINSRPLRLPALLMEDFAWLRDNIPSADVARQAYLEAMLRAVETTLQILAGEDIPYMEEVQRIYDIMPQRVHEDQFLQAQNDLDAHLPGRGSLADRFEKWRNQYSIPSEELLPALRIVQSETSSRTKALVDLPRGDSIDLELVNEQPWSAYNWFQGNGHSLIQFNTDIPKSALSLVDVMAHEGYPGHHTEAVVKEEQLWRRHGYGETSAMLLNSPAAVISEGIATTAVEIIFPNREHLHWTLDVLLPAIPMRIEETAEQLWSIQQAMRQLRWVTGNAAILYHSGQLSQEEASDYIRTYSLTSPKRAQKSLEFITHPLYGSYPFTYTEGYELISKAAGNGDKMAVFLSCLTGQILPSQLAADGAALTRG
jgi:hypothetical protein